MKKKINTPANTAVPMALAKFKLTDSALLSEDNSFIATLDPLHFADVTSQALVSKLQATAGENVQLKWKIEQILMQLAAIIGQFPDKISFFWLITNVKTVVNFVKAVIDILRGNEPSPLLTRYNATKGY